MTVWGAALPATLVPQPKHFDSASLPVGRWLYLPAAHNEHVVEAAVPEYVPAPQSRQDVSDVASVVFRNLPAT